MPDYLTEVKEGAFYGWPFSYWGQHIDKRAQPQNPEMVERATKPDYALGNHVAPLGLAFAEGELVRDLPRDVEAIGIGIFSLVAVGSPDQEKDPIPSRHRRTVPFHVACDRAGRILRGRGVAEHAAFDAAVGAGGANGCHVLARGGERVRSFPAARPDRPVVDTNGAGDTHCGVLAAMLLEGADLPTAALRANAAAALSSSNA